MEFTYSNDPLTQGAIYSYFLTVRNTNLTIDGTVIVPRQDLETRDVVWPSQHIPKLF